MALSNWNHSHPQYKGQVRQTTFSPSGKRALDDFIKETAESREVPGFVLGVTNVDGEIYFKGGGNHVVGDPSSGDIDPDSVFWICSQTKLITALATLKLIEDGEITLDTPLGDYLPEFQNPVVVDKTSTPKTKFRPAQTVITVRHLLNFSSGLFYPILREDVTAFPAPYTSNETQAAPDPYKAFMRTIIGDFPGVPLKFEPGTDFVYGFSADALGFLIQKVSGMTLDQFCRERIFDPLEMDSCSFYLSPALKKRFVSLSVRTEGDALKPWAGEVKIMEQDPDKANLHFGGIGAYGSMRDYLKLLRYLMQINAGQSVANPIIQAESVRQLFVPALTEKGAASLSKYSMVPDTQWGTGIAIATEDRPQGRKKGSIWWTGWAGTEHFIDPVSGIAVVFGTQVVPLARAKTVATWSKLEALVYAALDNTESLKSKL